MDILVKTNSDADIADVVSGVIGTRHPAATIVRDDSDTSAIVIALDELPAGTKQICICVSP